VPVAQRHGSPSLEDAGGAAIQSTRLRFETGWHAPQARSGETNAELRRDQACNRARLGVNRIAGTDHPRAPGRLLLAADRPALQSCSWSRLGHASSAWTDQGAGCMAAGEIHLHVVCTRGGAALGRRRTARARPRRRPAPTRTRRCKPRRQPCYRAARLAQPCPPPSPRPALVRSHAAPAHACAAMLLCGLDLPKNCCAGCCRSPRPRSGLSCRGSCRFRRARSRCCSR